MYNKPVTILTRSYGRIAQLVEQRPLKPTVGGSSPPTPTVNRKPPLGGFLLVGLEESLGDIPHTLTKNPPVYRRIFLTLFDSSDRVLTKEFYLSPTIGIIHKSRRCVEEEVPIS